MDSENTSRSGGWSSLRAGAVLLAFLAIAAFLLLSEHRAHVFGILPYLLLLLCPVLHLILHGGHGRTGGAHEGPAREGGKR
jgi:hypothetical protein